MPNNSIFNQLLSILILPFTVVVIVPYVILKYSPKITIYNEIPFIKVISVVFTLIGVIILQWTIRLLSAKGKGTLAPWNPTIYLVINGPYRYVRNPMIIGVVLLIFSIAFYFNALIILLWGVFFFFINSIYFELFEEPELERKFGDDYIHYKTEVRRWIPRRNPYRIPNETKLN